ncbi:uncharacterized protein TRUGW13939_11259 [Talaromyces rugulosus]|uniref:SRPBCC domain-containing protein n=1 Tax=Talaromyces rugulosus TaxID=121627 RepID=A0A7H8RCS7_TALRU|nr:uncharacterized protein TRUGW13939_11259 [Talaromyces rugulosus]QKX64086.1 hypothetical protein TRUGW13939_11259 [Talaromyces rugulosus]
MLEPITISAQIEIAASPKIVRAAFLDFSRVKKTTGWEIEVKGPAKKETELKKGDRVNVNINGFKFSPIVRENSPEMFMWDGTIPGLGFILSGKHHFYFLPSEVNTGGTTLIQKEYFTGLVTMVWPGKDTQKWSIEQWNEFNEAFKKDIEQSSS